MIINMQSQEGKTDSNTAAMNAGNGSVKNETEVPADQTQSKTSETVNIRNENAQEKNGTTEDTSNISKITQDEQGQQNNGAQQNEKVEDNKIIDITESKNDPNQPEKPPEGPEAQSEPAQKNEESVSIYSRDGKTASQSEPVERSVSIHSGGSDYSTPVTWMPPGHSSESVGSHKTEGKLSDITGGKTVEDELLEKNKTPDNKGSAKDLPLLEGDQETGEKLKFSSKQTMMSDSSAFNATASLSEVKGEIYEEEVPIVEEEKKSSQYFGEEVIDEEDEEDTSQKYLEIEEMVLDDLGREVKIKQRVPIIREIHQFERISLPAEEEEEEEEEVGLFESKQHIYIETVKRTIKKYQFTHDGKEVAEEEDIDTVLKETRRRPPIGSPVFYKKIEDGVEIQVMVDWEREAAEEEQEILKQLEERIQKRRDERKKRQEKRLAVKQLSPRKSRIHKFVKTMHTKEVSPGLFQEVPGLDVEEIEEEIEEEDLDEFEDISIEDDEISEKERDVRQTKIDSKMQKIDEALLEKLKKILITLSLEKRKQAKLTKLILIATEMSEKSATKASKYTKKKMHIQSQASTIIDVRSGRSNEEEMKKLYLEKVMEYRELRSAFLLKLALEKKKIEETKQTYEDLKSKLESLRQAFTEKLNNAITKLKPKYSEAFRFQNPEVIVRRVIDLEKRVFEVRKTILEKDKELAQYRQELEDAKGGEEGTCFKYDLLTKELFSTNNKNDRREAKLESLKQCIQKHSQTLAHINQKLSAVMRANNQKCDQLEKLQEFLTQKRFERQGIHASKNEMETILQKTLDNFKSEDYPLLLREYELIQEDMKEKKQMLEELKSIYKEKLKNYSSKSATL